LREYAEAQAILDQLEPKRETLAPLDRYNLEWLAAECKGDRGTALRAVRRAAELSPRSMWTFRLGVVALMSNRPGEARAAMESLDPEHGFVRGWVSFSYHYASALHYLGEHDAELVQAERGRSGSPHSLGALGIELRARAGQGDVAGVKRLTDESVGLPAEWLDTPGTTMQLGAHELAAHGEPEAARELAARALAWHRALPPAEAATPARREDLGRSLLDAGELAEAERVFEELAALSPEQVDLRGMLGVLAARRGDAAGAAAADRWLAALERPYLFGESYYWRAAIAAWSDKPQEAFDLLRTAYAHGRPYHWAADQHLHIDPVLAPLRGEAGFADLLAPKG
jgi:tetratricopeptide (TPR) repeat protein